jgi:hypothetical protein
MNRLSGVVCLLVLLLVAGCSARARTMLSVALELTTCPATSSACYVMRVQNVDVTAIRPGLIVPARTGKTGVAELQLDGPGSFTVEARSFIIEGDAISQVVKIDRGESKEIVLSGTLRASQGRS